MQKGDRVPSLDGFRAVSIGLVIITHAAISIYSTRVPDQIFKLVSLGKIGVEMFFVISGFVITLLLIREREKTGHIDFKAFYTRRILRIFPAFYFFLIIVAILNYQLDLRIPAVLFLSAGLYFQNFAPWGSHWLVAHTWSLAIEEQFYILWPLLFAAIRKSHVSILWIVALVMGSFMRSFHYKFTGLSMYLLAPFFMYADFLFSGACLAFIFFHNREYVEQLIKKIHPSLVYVAVVTMCVVSVFEFHSSYDIVLIPIGGTIVNACICFLLLYFIISENTLGYRILNSPAAKFAGRLSYSLYIWQQLFISPTNYWFTKFPLNLLLTLAAAMVSYYIVERPFLKLKERFESSTSAHD